MNTILDDRALEMALHPAPGDAYRVIYDQLNATVQQLVLAAVARARQADAMQMAHTVASLPGGIVRARLSERESEVLRRIAGGDSNKMIARALGLSPHTVKRHVANILDKLGARSRSQAAAWLLSQP